MPRGSRWVGRWARRGGARAGAPRAARAERLHRAGAISDDAREQARRAETSALREHEEARFAADAAAHEVEAGERAVPRRWRRRRRADDWAVFVVAGGRARLRRVEAGALGAFDAEIRDGVAEGALVVLHPSDRLRDGARVSPRR